MTTMLSVEEALQTVLTVAQRLPPVTVSLQHALGKILAQDVAAPDPLPPYPASIKDGYAVVASDGPGEYPVITESRAGDDGIDVTVTSGTVAYVTTGGYSVIGEAALLWKYALRRQLIPKILQPSIVVAFGEISSRILGYTPFGIY